MELRIFIIVLLFLESVNCFEWPAIPYQLTQSCRANQSYDSSTFQCLNCPPNSAPASDGMKIYFLLFVGRAI